MSIKVLLVDNESVITEGLSKLINWEAFGFEIIGCAVSGEDAISKIREHVPELVITDIRMPQMDGLELSAYIKENFPEIEIIILTGFPDFEYAKASIKYDVVDYILKPTREDALLEAINKAKTRIEKKRGVSLGDSQNLQQQLTLGELIYSNKHSLLYTVNRLLDLGINLSSGYYVLYLLINTDKSKVEEELFTVRGLFESYCNIPSYYVDRSDNSCYYVVVSSDINQTEQICQRVINKINEDADYELTIGISGLHNEPTELMTAAAESEDAQKFTGYASQPSLMKSEDIPKLSDNTAQVLLNSLREVELAIENSNPTAARENYRDFSKMVMEAKLPFSQLKKLLEILAGFCFRLLISLTEEPNFGVSLVAEKPEAILQELSEIIDYTLKERSRIPENIDSIIYDTKQFIDANYAEQLSLDELAGRVHLSPGYFSKLFKKQMGENLSSYISRTRIEQAKLLLRTSNLKTYEIAEAVGIYDPVYFSKTFKKLTGKKPKDFRLGTKEEKHES